MPFLWAPGSRPCPVTTWTFPDPDSHHCLALLASGASELLNPRLCHSSRHPCGPASPTPPGCESPPHENPTPLGCEPPPWTPANANRTYYAAQFRVEVMEAFQALHLDEPRLTPQDKLPAPWPRGHCRASTSLTWSNAQGADREGNWRMQRGRRDPGTWFCEAPE